MRALLQEASAIEQDLIMLRRSLHRQPELGRNEFATSERILKELRAAGIEADRIAQTGVVGILRGTQPGRCVALRADMDALPIQEQTGLPYASQVPGVMHACGHDMHTAALIGAAKLLALHPDEIHGEVRFFFQPDEEGDGGAQRMIDEGCMEGVDAVFGAHVSPEYPAGMIGVRPGNFYAASNPFDITVHGQSSHGAEPHLGRDAIVAASAMVGQIQTLVSRELDPLNPAVISIGTFHAGTARNIIADEAQLCGIIRCFGKPTRSYLAERLEALIGGIADAHHVQAEVQIQWGYGGVINDADMARFVRSCAETLLGGDAVYEAPISLTSEDFGAFLDVAPGCYWHLGVGRPGCDAAPIHSPDFNPDESALRIAAAMHAGIALNFLNS